MGFSYNQYFKKMSSSLQSPKSNTQKNHVSALKSQKVSFRESVMGAYTNIAYRLGFTGGFRVPRLLSKNNQSESECIILGKVFDSQEEAKQIVKRIIWFTYRERVKIVEDINSDVGWGCLPRVGQMLLAQALIRYYTENTQNITEEFQMKIIQSFLDDEGNYSKYSLSKILRIARKKFQLHPGEWFHIGQIAEVLKKLQQQSPMAGTQNLKIVFFNQAVIFIEEIFQKAGIRRCSCEEKLIICQKCHQLTEIYINKELKTDQRIHSEKSQQCEEKDPKIKSLITLSQRLESEENKGKIIQYDPDQMEQEYLETEQKQEDLKKQQFFSTNIGEKMHKLKNQLLLIVSIRVGTKYVDEDSFMGLKKLLGLRSSLGIMGGVPRKALYIVGYSGNQLVYLDPHYVQDYVDKKTLFENMETFFCKDFRTLYRDNIDPSMALAFYLRSLEDLVQLFNYIESLKERFEKKSKSFFISILESDHYHESSQCIVRASGQNFEFPVNLEQNSYEFQDIVMPEYSESPRH